MSQVALHSPKGWEPSRAEETGKPTRTQGQTLVRLNVPKAGGCRWTDNSEVMRRKLKAGRKVGRPVPSAQLRVGGAS